MLTLPKMLTMMPKAALAYQKFSLSSHPNHNQSNHKMQQSHKMTMRFPANLPNRDNRNTNNQSDNSSLKNINQSSRGHWQKLRPKTGYQEKSWPSWRRRPVWLSERSTSGTGTRSKWQERRLISKIWKSRCLKLKNDSISVCRSSPLKHDRWETDENEKYNNLRY